MRVTCLVCLTLMLVSARSLSADTKKDPSLLTIDRIYDSEEFAEEKFAARWLDDGSGYLTIEASEGVDGGREIVRHNPRTGRSEILVPAAHLIPPGESEPLAIDDYALSENGALLLIYTGSKRVWRKKSRGDYWVLDRSSRQLHKLGGKAKPATLMFAKFSPQGRHVAYVRQNNLYVEELATHRITALTKSGSDTVINGTFDWVYEEELGLRDGFRWSPDSRSIAYWQLNTRGVRKFSLIDNSNGLYPTVKRFEYPKVGERNSACRVGVVDIKGGPTRWLAVPGDPREHYIARMEWTAESKDIVLQQLNRLQNTNRLMRADADSGAVRTVLTEQDDAWVEITRSLKWRDGGRQFVWQSERDGWRHLYRVSRDGKRIDPVTPGEYDVVELLHVDAKKGDPGKKWLYFLASPDNPTQRYLYRCRLDGTDRQRVTPEDQPGSHGYRISPDGRWAIHTRSSSGSPPVIDLVELPGHARVRTLVKNRELRKKVDRLKRQPVEFFRVDIGKGGMLDGWCMKPSDFDPAKKYPLLVYVYGEPAGQTVRDGWGGKSYLWHLMLAERGYLVMSFDNRGTAAPRGRAWRKAAYRKIGILAPADQAAALREVLHQRSYVDRTRIGIWGWSGGGSMSLNAIFKYPKLYHTAMAVASVSNQRYYDTIYQERYMDLPGDNVEGYTKGSPLNFAHRLQGNLLLVHGTGDDNCHYQTTEVLIDELIRHNKQFTMMAYPNRSHSIREGSNTQRHLRQLLTSYLEENLPPGPADE